eukprot:5077515-Amphidinium_carterae.1
MITRGSLRPRGSYSSTRPRGTTPQPRQRLQVYREENGSTHDDFFLNATKIEDIDDLTGEQTTALQQTTSETTNCQSEDYVMTGEEDPYKGHYILFNDMSKSEAHFYQDKDFTSHDMHVPTHYAITPQPFCYKLRRDIQYIRRH